MLGVKGLQRGTHNMGNTSLLARLQLTSLHLFFPDDQFLFCFFFSLVLPVRGISILSTHPRSLQICQQNLCNVMGTVKISCTLCRQRKVKCDRTIPRCINCLKRGLVCQFPNSFRSQSLKRPDPGHEEKDVQWYYGHNSSEFLERLLSWKIKVKEEAPPLKLHALPRLVEDDNHNLAMVKLIVDRLLNSPMAKFYRIFVDFEDIRIRLRLTILLTCDSYLVICGIALVCNRYVHVLSEDQLSELSNSMTSLLNECPLTESKIIAMLLLLEYHYTRFDVNVAYRLLFLAASDAYALGIHLQQSRLWIALAFYDSAICSCVGRPTALNHLLLSLAEPKPDELAAVVETVWRCNAEARRTPLEYERILVVDSECDQKRQLLSHDDIFSTQLSVILLANQAKLHFSFLANDFSVFKVQKVLEKLLGEFRHVLEHLKMQRELHQENADLGNFRLQLPFVWCFGYQSLLVLLVFLTKKQLYTEDITSEVDSLMNFAKENSDIELDPIFAEVLSTVHKCIVDLKDERFNCQSDTKGISAIDLVNPEFFHEVEFWSSLASLEQSSWEASTS